MAGKPATDASIVIIVLWGVLFLSMLAVATTGYVRPQLGVAIRLKDHAQRVAVAKAGVQRTMWEMVDTATNPFVALNDSWNRDCGRYSNQPVGEGAYTILHASGMATAELMAVFGLVDEERKININTVSNVILTKLIALVGGVTSQQAAEAACAIVDWRGVDQQSLTWGTEDSYYAMLTPPYPCKNKKYDVLEELLLVKGVTAQLFLKIKDYLTVYGRGAVNINTADARVLRCAGVSDELSGIIVAFRRGQDGMEATADDGVYSNRAQIADLLNADKKLSLADRMQLERVLDVRSDCFRGRCVGRLNGKKQETVVDFVFGLDGKIKYWREN